MTATAQVETTKSSRYLQALCGHFSRKVQTDYTPDQGQVNFSFGHCTLHAEPTALVIRVEATEKESLAQLKEVVGGHLERFASKDNLQVLWSNQTDAGVAV